MRSSINYRLKINDEWQDVPARAILKKECLNVRGQVIYTDKDAVSDTDIDYCANKPRYQKIDYILKNSVGFWGSNTSILLKRYPNNFSVN